MNALLEAIPDGFLLYGRDGKIRASNEKARAIFSVDGRDLAGIAISELVHHLEEPRTVSATPWREATAVAKGHGTRLEVSVAIVADTAGETFALSVRHASPDDAFSDTRSRLAAIIDSSDDAIVGKQLDGTILSWNKGAERIFGYTEGEVVGRKLSLLVPADRKDELDAILEQIRQGRRVEHFETLRRRKDGTIIAVSATISPVRDGSGRIVGASKVARDVTSDRLAREATRSALAQKGILLQEVHHRVKNNLQVIASLINMQMRTLPLGASRGALEECQGRVKAIAMIHEKLYQSHDFSRVPFVAYLRGLAETIFRTAGVTPTQVELSIDLGEVAIPIDKAIPCALIVNELITNSLKHAFPGGRRGHLWIRGHLIDNEMEIRIEDDGIGLPDSFSLVNSSSLGLELVTTLVEQLEGKLESLARPGGGASFSLRVPNATMAAA